MYFLRKQRGKQEKNVCDTHSIYHRAYFLIEFHQSPNIHLISALRIWTCIVYTLNGSTYSDTLYLLKFNILL